MLLTCGYVVQNADSEGALRGLIGRYVAFDYVAVVYGTDIGTSSKHFTFVIAFPTTTLIPQRVVLPITQVLHNVMVLGHTLMDALQAICFPNRELMETTGLHITQLTPAGTLRQSVFTYATGFVPWGVRLRCPNETCTGSINDVRARTHKKHDTVRFRCVACRQQTKDYLPAPSWLGYADRANNIVEYPLRFKEAPIENCLVGEVDMVPWDGKEHA